jgi:DNA mismatch repair protein MutS2
MFLIGAEVLVRAIKRRGVIAEVLRPGVYRVQVGALTITARDNELDAAVPSKKKQRAAIPLAPEDMTGEGHADGAAGLASIDLHGLTVDEARNRVVGQISSAILAGLKRVEIIHGIGTGRIKAAVTKDLRALSAVRAIKPHPSNPGVTIVYL